MGNPRKPDPEKFCVHCGTQLARKRYPSALECMAVFLKRRYCDQKCMAAAFVKPTSQPNSKRRRVTRFRGTSCEVCGATEQMTAHHIDGNLDNDSPSNIQTLCVSCHVTHHHRVRRAGLTVPGRATYPASRTA